MAQGTCLCGKVTVNFKLDKNTFAVCHCSVCRKWSGGPAMAVGDVSEVSFKGEDNIGVYSSSQWAERGFCKTCGTHLFYRMKSGGFINFPLGLLKDADHLKMNVQIFVDNKPPHYNFTEKTEMMTEAEVLEKFAPK